MTSATLDVQLFSRYLDNAPVIDIPGRMFPVEITYHPVREREDYVTAAVNCATNIHSNTPISSGDVLVFLTGEAEVHKACELLTCQLKGQKILPFRAVPLYGKQSREEQVVHVNICV